MQANIAAANSAAIAAERDAAAKREQVVTYEAFQNELNAVAARSGSATAALRLFSGASFAAAQGSAAHRFGMIGVGQQMQDLTVSLASGQRATTVFAQQLPQLAFALTNFGGIAGRVGTFLAGPWGAALFAGATVVGLFATRSNEAADAQNHLAEAGNAVSDAQSILGRMFDLTTGKLTSQNEVVREAIRLQAIVGQIEAERNAATAMRTLRALRPADQIDGGGQGTSFSEYLQGAGPEGGMSNLGNAPRDNPGVAAFRTLVENFGRTRNASVTAFRQSLEQLQAQGHLNGVDINAAVNEAITIANQRQHYQAYGDVRRIAEGQVPLPKYLSRPSSGAGGRERQDNRPDQARQALEQVTQINAEWDAQPALVDRASEAIRKLDRIIQQAQEQHQPGSVIQQLTTGATAAGQSIREGLIRQIVEPFNEAPKAVQRANLAMQQLAATAAAFPELGPQILEAAEAVERGLLRPYRDLLENMTQQYDVQQLISAGRDDEAQALRVIQQLEERTGTLTEERRQVIRDGVAALADQARAYDLIRERQQQNLQAVGQIRTSIEGLLGNGNVSQFGSGILSAFKNLNAQAITERLFGPALREMEDFATGRTRVRMSNEQAAQAVDTLRGEVTQLTDRNTDQARSVEQVTTKLDLLRDAAANAATAMTHVATGGGGGGGGGGPGVTADGSNWQNAGSGPAALQATTSMFALPGQWAGLRRSGNLDLMNRPRVRNPDGSISTVLTISIGTHDGEVLIPRVSNQGRILSDQQAAREYERTGAHLGIFDTPAHADAYAEALHRQQAAMLDASNAAPAFTDALTQISQVIPQALGAITHPMDQFSSIITGFGDDVGATVGDLVDLLDRLPANDNHPVVTGARRPTLTDASIPDPVALFTRGLTTTLTQLFGNRQLATKLAGVMGKALEGAALGDMFDGFARSLGVRLPSGLARAGGALLNQIPGFAQSAGPIGAAVAGNLAIGQLLGNDEIKHGKLMSLVIGPFLTRLFGSALRGSSTITGATSPITTTGNSTKYKAASVTSAGSVQEMLAHIADALGASLAEGIGAVSIGVRKGDYRVDPTGKGVTKTSKGAIDFGKDAEAAIQAAVLDLIRDGVIDGLREGSKRLLQAAKDLDTGLDKALKFEGVFMSLKERLDPVGAALDALNKQFDGLRRIFQEAGASAEELAQLEQLYSLERADAIDEATQRMTGALKDLLDDLTTNNDALSLRDRLSFAHATYDPLAARVAAGDKTVDYDAFADAARTILDIQRQISGSGDGYFDLLAQITDLTRKALEGQENIISLATAGAGGTGSTPSTSDTGPVVGAIGSLGDFLGGILSGQLSAVNDNLGTLIEMQGRRTLDDGVSVSRVNF
jgi:hypothetical protein